MYSIKLMQFGDVSYNGELTTECFADGGLKQAQLMDDCVNCLAYDDQVHRPDCYGYRIFLGPRISGCHTLNPLTETSCFTHAFTSPCH
jgi:hypothetical protein